MKKLFCGSLPWSTTDQSLGNLFTQSGTVISAKVIKDRETNRSRGFGFVEMSTPEEAQNAVKNLNGVEVEGRRIIVKLAEERPRR